MRHLLCFLGWHRWRLNKVATTRKREVNLWYCCTRCGRFANDWVEFYKP
mgnify:CR=1 FL=1